MKVSSAIASGALALAIVIGGSAAVSSLHKDVTLKLDGQTQSGASFALTVGDVLASNNVAIDPGDIVTPSLDTPATDGQTIEVKFLKDVKFNIDGKEQIITTNASTVAAALTHLSVPELEQAAVSLPLQSALPQVGAEVKIVTPKTVTLKVAGKKQQLETTGLTVADLLTSAGVEVDANDRINPALETLVVEKLSVNVDLVEVTQETVKESVKYDTDVKKNNSMWVSEVRVVKAGKKGKANRTYQVTTVNGIQTKRELISEVITKKPVAQVEEHGTKTTSNGTKINLARAGMWDKIAKCESGNNWSINTGNGYYGGLQFSRSSWNSNGGRDFAALPHQASRAEQITIANRYYAKSGLRPWSCRRVV